VERDCRKVDEIPFDFKRRRMSVVIDYEDRHVLICKGAVEEVAATCEHYQIDEDINPLVRLIRDDLLDEYRNLSADGYRVLAIAYREFDRTKQTFSSADESGMILPRLHCVLRPGEGHFRHRHCGAYALRRCGENPHRRQRAGHEKGLSRCRHADHQDRHRPATRHARRRSLRREVDEANVFARLTPDQKEKVIKTLRAKGHVVGFMGDGINDVLAMKAADVGISVDTAVDVAKESADIILLEKSLLVLEDGIMEGRQVFGNIIKYIKMGASSNFGNMFSVVGGAYFLPFLRWRRSRCS